jgi:uncharacterized membrane protein YfcA
MFGYILGTMVAAGRLLTEIPEPGMMLLFGVSVGALGLYMGQKKKP